MEAGTTLFEVTSAHADGYVLPRHATRWWR